MPSFAVTVLDEAGYARLDEERATELCAAAFATQNLDLDRLGEVSVALVEPDEIQSLNFKYRDKDSPTDVLSFEIDGAYGEMFGEVVICPEYAEMDVEELVVHGALHLAGFDHGEDFEGGEMARAQAGVMGRVRGG